MIFSEFIHKNSGNYRCLLRNNAEERVSRLLRGGSLRSGVREDSLFFLLILPYN